MIIRILLLTLATYTHLEFYDAFYTQNFQTGMYPPEADSIGIPILMSKFLTLGIVFISSPFVLLGNRTIREKLGEIKIRFSLLIAIIFSSCYILIILFAYVGASTIFFAEYRNIAIYAVGLFIVPLSFLMIDVMRLIRHLKIRKKINAGGV
jgi:hypothetical protein